ncbi:MAG TPA: hypothetical protein VE090_06015 [Methylomirabilota bacterium]|nr:hypothetical protein [Methylomirabilota bacterium]
MDKKILEILQKLAKSVEKIERVMVTKDDLKTELAQYATKDDLKTELAQYATKDDLKNVLANYPTKTDLINFGETIVKDLGNVMHDLIVETDNQKATNKDLMKLEVRVDRIEQKLTH